MHLYLICPEIQIDECLLDVKFKNLTFQVIHNQFETLYVDIRGPYKKAKGPLYFNRLYFSIELHFLLKDPEIIRCLPMKKIILGIFYPFVIIRGPLQASQGPLYLKRLHFSKQSQVLHKKSGEFLILGIFYQIRTLYVHVRGPCMPAKGPLYLNRQYFSTQLHFLLKI